MIGWLKRLFSSKGTKSLVQNPEKLPQELQKIDIKPGEGAEALAGDSVKVHYTGWLYHPEKKDHKGRKFDSSKERHEAFTFLLGAGQVIQGWDLGVVGMQAGGQRRLIIPSTLAYGERGAGGVIPANAVLVFDVDLLEVRRLSDLSAMT